MSLCAATCRIWELAAQRKHTGDRCFPLPVVLQITDNVLKPVETGNQNDVIGFMVGLTDCKPHYVNYGSIYSKIKDKAGNA